jgi:GcrA cell cycle regulator
VSAAQANSPWPERVPDLVRHHVAGLSPSKIAATMGLTLGQVCGQVHRLRQQGRLLERAVLPTRGGPGVASSPDAEAQRRAKLRARALARKAVPSSAAAVESAAPESPAPESPAIVAATPPLRPDQVNPQWITPEWPRERIVRLWNLWTAASPVLAIARELRTSKNAVVGTAGRIGLPSRPSPIRRTDAQAAPSSRPTVSIGAGATLPPLASVVAIDQTPAPAAPRPRLPGQRVITCCWPIGEPGTRSFRFCNTESEAGKPYCPDHVKMAYRRLRPAEAA